MGDRELSQLSMAGMSPPAHVLSQLPGLLEVGAAGNVILAIIAGEG